ncbi:DNA helicase II [Corynebacterium occultum]|uniref:DNA 3'-5' helicase n=1 Tax=Corynebacterium occultum TaxID=2675219 RepID=A0A6B8W6Y7_9CORY|nr:DNA helicase II [Corynebacterium occultum]
MREWSGPAAALLDGPRGKWRVTGVAGAGVSSLLVDTTVQLIRDGMDPAEIMVITPAKESASRLRRELIAQLDGNYVSEGSLVRSIHSLAFALLRQDRPARLITGAEQDAVIRELLEGHAEEGRGTWPPEHRPALKMVGFARQLRDFLLRSIERGLGPEELIEWGRRFDRPVWAAAGDFLREYEQVSSLAGTQSYSASELVTAALRLPAQDLGIKALIIDDAQHLDPKSAELLARLMEQTQLSIIGGDPAQSVFHFRGANPEFLQKFPVDHEVVLAESFREPTRKIAITDTSASQQALVADTIRRAHLLEGVEWCDIAVIVRSSGMIGPVRRALLNAGVPVHLNPTDVVLSEQPIVAGMILGVRALSTELSAADLESLLLGPIGGADPVTLRRLLRGLRQFDFSRRAIDVLREMIAVDYPFDRGELGGKLTERELDILERIRTVLQAGHHARAEGQSVEEVLWALWDATGLSDRLMAASLRGGAAGSQADRDLDAMMTLFDAAGDYAERRPTAGIDSFIRHIAEQELPTGVRDRRGVEPDAVNLLTAHGAGGQEWHTVVIAGVQEGTWPSLGETGSLFGQEELVDLADLDIDPGLPISHAADRLAEERRLFHMSATRATGELLITAVESSDSDTELEPSRFLDEIEPPEEHHHISLVAEENADDDEISAAVRVLSTSSLIAELRRAVSNPDLREDFRSQAARQLARLAAAGVPGATPEHWWSTTEVSEHELLDTREQIPLSPSKVEALQNCPLNAVLSRVEEEEETPIHMLKGSLVHAFAEALARGADQDRAAELVSTAYENLIRVPAWQRELELAAWQQLIDTTARWVAARAGGYELLGVEVEVDVPISDEVRIRGRMDRLDRDPAGELHIVDFKTGKNKPSDKAMADHAQLAVYQLALSRGALNDGRVTAPAPGQDTATVGGAELVFPAAPAYGKAGVRQQAPKTREELAELADSLPALADQLRGPRLLARINPNCPNCPLKPICPVQSEGKMSTDV